MPAAWATANEHTTSAAAWSTNGNVFTSFGYGSATRRLPEPVAASSAADRQLGNHAYGLVVGDVGEPGHELGHERPLRGERPTRGAASTLSNSG